MSANRFLTLAMACLALSATTRANGSASATAAATQVVRFVIHADPADMTSKIVFAVTLDLETSQTSGSRIGWQINSMKFRQPDYVAGADRRWLDRAPTVDTTDGLWWISHADLQNPVLSEFTNPPAITGTADALDTAYADLKHQLAGSHAPSMRADTSATILTAIITYLLQLLSEQEPEEEGENEIAVTDDVNDAPIGQYKLHVHPQGAGNAAAQRATAQGDGLSIRSATLLSAFDQAKIRRDVVQPLSMFAR